jgi:hypothetical protein
MTYGFNDIIIFKVGYEYFKFVIFYIAITLNSCLNNKGVVWWIVVVQ